MDDHLFDAVLEPFDPDAEEDDEMPGETLNDFITLEEIQNHGVPVPGVARQPPVKPNQEVIDEHILIHATYADWCPACVAARGQIRPHRRSDHNQDTLPVIQLDYLMWSKDYETSETPDNDFQDKSLTRVDTKTGNAMATVVKKKGAWAFAEEVVVISLRYQRIILQTDGEPAIKMLARHIQNKLGVHRFELRQTPRYDSRANGAVENMNKICAARTRNLMAAAAENYGLDFRHDSYLVPWAIRHALWTYTRYANDEDSSPHFVTHGRNYDGEVASKIVDEGAARCASAPAGPPLRSLPLGARGHSSDKSLR